MTWSLELRRGATRQRLANGIAQGSKEVKVGPVENLAVQPGDLVSLLIGPRDGNHSCDLTAIDLVADERRRRRTRMESGQGCFARRARRQSARRPLRQRGRVAFLHRAGQGRQRDRAGDSRRVRCWRMAIGAERGGEAASSPSEVQKLLTSGAPAGEGQPGREVVSATDLARRAAVQRGARCS